MKLLPHVRPSAFDVFMSLTITFVIMAAILAGAWSWTVL
jgi:hypothetical protein